MNKASKYSAVIFLLFLSYALTMRDDKKESAQSATDTAAYNQETKNSFAKYIPNLPSFSRREEKGLDFHVKRKEKLGNILISGKGLGQIGISPGHEELAAMGPGAFAYLKNKNAFAILDNHNKRLNFYSVDGKEEATSINFPAERKGLGLTVDNNGQVVLLARRYNPNTGTPYAYYEIWRLDESSSSDPWGAQRQAQQNFSFSNHETHGAAQSLEMQSIGEDLLFKGLQQNEFHYLKNGNDRTVVLNGFPTQNGKVLSVGSYKEEGEKFIQLQGSALHSPVKTSEDINRLNSYRLLPSGLIALNLEDDLEKNLPREVVLINPQDGKVHARTTLKKNEDVEIDQDVFYQENNDVLQLTTSSQKTQKDKPNFEIIQTQFEK
jgi:hypothetical protein